jgi:hypothetical protein
LILTKDKMRKRNHRRKIGTAGGGGKGELIVALYRVPREEEDKEQLFFRERGMGATSWNQKLISHNFL